MNWSMITCAPFAKSPNCASQITSASGRGDRVAVLEPEARVLGERRVVDLEARLRARAGAACGAYGSPVSTSCSTAWRCANVPRSESWPVSRIGTPSRSSERERERLGVAPVDAAVVERLPRRRSSWVASFGCDGEPLGHRQQLVVQLARARPRRAGGRRAGRAASSSSPRGACSSVPARTGACASAMRPRDALADLGDVVLGDDALDDQRCAYSSATGGCSAMRSYICGCV